MVSKSYACVAKADLNLKLFKYRTLFNLLKET